MRMYALKQYLHISALHYTPGQLIHPATSKWCRAAIQLLALLTVYFAYRFI